MALKQVVLPAPFGPIRPKISPRYNENATWSSATTPPKRSVTSSTSSSGSLSCTACASGCNGSAALPVALVEAGSGVRSGSVIDARLRGHLDRAYLHVRLERAHDQRPLARRHLRRP